MNVQTNLNLYLLTNNTVDGYDTYDSMIVAAENEDAARLITPDTRGWNQDRSYKTWCREPEDVIVEFIGTAKKDTESGIVLASFNAG